MYKRVSTSLDFVEREKEVLEYWKAHDIFHRCFTEHEGRPAFVFYDGPPTANGRPHIGHVETRAIKDLIPRFWNMKGYQVFRKAGWDTHGLPVELEVEKELGIDGKPEIEKYGVAPFIEKCKESVWKYKSEWELMSDRVGFWADMENPYITYDDDYVESIWWSLKRIAEKGLLYKGHKVVPYCPRCGTALSSHEVAQGYKDITETSVFVRFKLANEEESCLLAWTTTPWTLPSNVALVVNAGEDYVYARQNGSVYILAKALAESVLGAHEIVKTVKGKDLIGLEYEPLYPFVGQTKEKAFVVVADDYVTLTDGTGIVHCAPAFGEDDARVGRDNGLPFVQLVDERGRFIEAVTPWKGLFVKDADPLIVEEMKTSGKLFKSAEYTHSYPFCWRCDTPLLYYARSSWFIRMTAVREQLVRNNRSVNWVPDHIKEGRMGNFVENVIDWGLSRERYWGTPLPAWVCEDCGEVHVVGSRDELRKLGQNLTEPIEMHKPYVDQITLKCQKCGGVMRRTPEVIDCWYDSGAMPFAQLHYPFENKELFEKIFPANFISEAVDQTRGWFYTLLAISTLLFDRAPFENCIVMGHVQDKNGIKMSKHVGNVITPWEVLDKQGADAVRWYFYAASAPWLPSRFSHEAVLELQRKYMGTLWNSYAFYVLYAQIDGFNPCQMGKPKQLGVMDRWVLSKLHTLIGQVDENLSAYRVTEAARALSDFGDELSNWYVRRCRERFWGPEMTDDKHAAYSTLHEVLVTLSKLTAPFTPFMAEQIYLNLVKGLDPGAPDSVHLCAFPQKDEAFVDPKLEEGMELVLRAVALG
ncbi:MAG: isoleucine--tRNA ligase, partial [Christensenellaceae bacterium]|nr:isoleucine--tRNA ligase [Christensenellaceae bacterium]